MKDEAKNFKSKLNLKLKTNDALPFQENLLYFCLKKDLAI